MSYPTREPDQNLTARAFLPESRDGASLRAAARRCHGCPLYLTATQTVFGRGSTTPRLVLVGEQPGDEEDRRGEPFVGPAGRLLAQGLEDAGIAPDLVYFTNVVKHFKWQPRGRRRIHSKPAASEINACLPWLHAELALLQPELLVCLGATAAQALLGAGFRVSQQRGQVLQTRFAARALATAHPSSVLRAPAAQRERAYAQFVEDLRRAAACLVPDGAASRA